MNKGIIIAISGIAVVVLAYFLLSGNNYKYIYNVTPNNGLM